MSNKILSDMFKEIYADSLNDLFNNFRWNTDKTKLYYEPIIFFRTSEHQKVKILILELE